MHVFADSSVCVEELTQPLIFEDHNSRKVSVPDIIACKELACSKHADGVATHDIHVRLALMLTDKFFLQ